MMHLEAKMTTIVQFCQKLGRPARCLPGTYLMDDLYMDDPLEQYKDLFVKDSTKAQISDFEFTATRYLKISRLRKPPATGKVVCKIREGVQTCLAPRSRLIMAHQGRFEGLKL